MTNTFAETSPSTRGRILAAFYLFVIMAGVTAQAFITWTAGRPFPESSPES